MLKHFIRQAHILKKMHVIKFIRKAITPLACCMHVYERQFTAKQHVNLEKHVQTALKASSLAEAPLANKRYYFVSLSVYNEKHICMNRWSSFVRTFPKVKQSVKSAVKH